MRIGFDAKRLFHNQTGLGVYSRLLVQHLHQLAPALDLVLFSPAIESSSYHSQFTYCQYQNLSQLLGRSLLARRVKAMDCQVFHGLSHELPPAIKKTNTRTVVTIHDLIFERMPKLFPYIDRQIYRQKWRYSSRVADLIVAVSNSTRRDLIELYGIEAERIHVIHPLHDPVFDEPISNQAKFEISQKYQLPSNFFLYVGAVNRRKNLKSILIAMSRQPEVDRMPLVVIGTGANYYRECQTSVKNLGLNDEVIFCNHVPNQDLPPFYSLAQALVYPSLYEGFGIPLIESLLCGSPVITSKVSSLPEAAGPGALYVDPHDADDIAAAMTALASDPEKRSELVASGKAHLTQFDNRKLVKKMLEVYQS